VYKRATTVHNNILSLNFEISERSHSAWAGLQFFTTGKTSGQGGMQK